MANRQKHLYVETVGQVFSYNLLTPHLMVSSDQNTGMHMRDMQAGSGFRSRLCNSRDSHHESVALRRLSRLLAQATESVLQKLVNAAVEFCGADGAGISLEESGKETFRWIVIAGSFAPYLKQESWGTG